MKKNTMMRIASCLLIAVLMTTCVISGTFAKYTTKDNAADSARVAKWGVVIDVTGEEAFAEKYDNAASASGTKVVSVDNTAADDSVLAPGTNGTLTTFKITGKPEVMLDVKADVNVELDGWIVDAATYFPVVIKVNGTPVAAPADPTLANYETAIEAAIINAIIADASVTPSADASTATKRYDANTDFGAAESAVDVTVTWEWPFEVDADDVADGVQSDATDAKDTVLGNLETAPTISCSVVVTATQVD